ncbi:MAG: CoA-binding protein [Thermodesulfobacteriota bacterium]|nr:CoA-binding protein [Thermodesulfobacteriota bacterium]
MLKSITESPLYPIVNPKSIAFFGASNNISSMGTTQLNSLMGLGFEGTVYPVHPKEETVQGLKAYRRVLDLPEVPDLAILVIPTRIVGKTLSECGKKGIRHAIIISGGFGEAGKKGKALEKEIIEIADNYGIRFIGPNCLGVTNPHHKLNTTFLRYEGPAGFIGMASQSGSFVTQMFDYLARRGLGFSTAFSVGNEANVDIVDCIKYLGACPNTKVIALYIEGIRNGKAFIKAAREITPHKPIVAFYVGGSEEGKKAGLSHTGAMAGPDKLYDGVFSQSGVIRAESISELFDFCQVLACLPKPAGRRVVIQTHSGGPGATAADSCGRLGLELPPLSPETEEKLAPLIPHTGSINNPIDLTFAKNPMDYFSNIPEILLGENNTDMLMIYFLMPTAMVRQSLEQMGVTEEEVEKKSIELIEGLCESVSGLLKAYGKPLVGYTFRSLSDHFIKGLLRRNVPVFASPEQAVRALQALVKYKELSEKLSS